MYAIIDIETTGGSSKTARITEIAIILHNGQQVEEEFCTLINPDCYIPPFITNLTGINNAMVANAPKFHEVAKRIVELTQNRIFVAHNATFDYNFVKAEFQSLGYNYQRETLCTVKLSRKLIPGYKSYSLGNICNDLGINFSDRHRALGDAKATALLFELLVKAKLNNDNKPIESNDSTHLHPDFDINELNKLPEIAGVLFLYNQQQQPIYICKTKNIKNEANSMFYKKAKAPKFLVEVVDISYEVTGSELVAVIREVQELKSNFPVHNKNTILNQSGLYVHTDVNSYIQFKIAHPSQFEQGQIIGLFDKKTKAVELVNKLVEQYNLCQKLCDVSYSVNACFNHELGMCKGACLGKETPASYNLRAQLALNSILNPNNNCLLIDKGRNFEERSAILIKNGLFAGLGYFDISESVTQQDIVECISTTSPQSLEMGVIINYLKNGKVEKVVKL